MPVGVCSSDDHCQILEFWFVQIVFFQEGIKTAEFPVVSEFNAMNIVWYSVELLSFIDDIVRWNENELRFFVEKPGDQPWTCHAIYFGRSRVIQRIIFEGDQLPVSDAEPVLLVVRSQRLSIDCCFDSSG